ncbi:MAG: hypothetical protein ACFFAK_05720 [Promethearchaeota archaeon]
MLLTCLAKGYNREDVESRKKLIKIAEIFSQYNPVNIIPKFTWKVSPVITAVYNNINTVKQVIQRLKRENFGISIVISGIISEIRNIINEMDLIMHTVHLSLGIFGKKELLPPEQKILEITTMCGHHCISTQSVEHYFNLIREGKISIEKSAQNLAKPCVCGIFNTSRAIEILNELKK